MKRWGKRTSDACRVCRDGKQTLHHILSSCKSSLDQGRYTFRHDSCLRSIVCFLNGKLNDGLELFSDLPGRNSGTYGTIPIDIFVTSQRPDLVLVDRQLRQVVLFELTVPWDRNVTNAHEYKMGKYASLSLDLERAGFKVDLFCFEVSVRGQISKANRARLKCLIHKYTNSGRTGLKSLIVSISKASLISSFAIFCARDEAHWSLNGDLSVQL